MKLTSIAIGVLALPLTAQIANDWQADFNVDKKNMGVHGSSPYFNLTPGHVLSFAHGKDTDTLTVLNQTKMIDGVECRVVEDRETKNGRLIELTHDYFAIDAATHDVYYMGEDVDFYKDGQAVGHGEASHSGSWLSGVNGAKFGLMVPGSPKPKQRFYEERAPKVGIGRGEIVAVDENVTTPAGVFDKCVHVVETSPLEKGQRDHKVYCPSIGMVRDGEMLLVKYGAR
jgi:hypothetical protein